MIGKIKLNNKNVNIKSKDLLNLGFKSGPVFKDILNYVDSLSEKITTKDLVLTVLKNILENPKGFENDENPLIRKIVENLLPKKDDKIKLLSKKEFKIWEDNVPIEVSAKEQMYTAMRLPITVAGALCPDAHTGYGLPIGGVLATDNAVIPYGVGVDIGCRMSISIFDMKSSYINGQKEKIINIINENTAIGAGLEISTKADVA